MPITLGPQMSLAPLLAAGKQADAKQKLHDLLKQLADKQRKEQR